MKFNFKKYAAINSLLAHCKKETIMIAIAAILGLTGATLEHQSRISFQENVYSQFQTKQIIAASRNLKAGATLTTADLKAVDFLVQNISTNMVPPDDKALLIGRTVSIDLVASDPITMSSLSANQNDRTIAERIPEGKRLYMMEVSDRVASHGFIRPGDFVDVLARINFPGRGLVSFTLLSNMQIVSMGKSINPKDHTIANQVSFFVSPEQMEILNFAEGEGEFRLSLRNPHDKNNTGSRKGIDRDIFLNSDMFYEYADQKVKVSQGEEGKDKK